MCAATARSAATRWQAGVDRAIAWLHAQEHQHFRLLQQNEASDWADIMPRSGYVLYSNALWYLVKQRFGLADARRHGPPLQPPVPSVPARPARVPPRPAAAPLRAPRPARTPSLYLSFVNLAFAGDEGDVFGNLLAILAGLADESMGHRIVKTISRGRQAADPYPIRVVLQPMSRKHELWRPYMARHQQNHPHQYHNGGIWPFVGGFWVLALSRLGLRERAWQALGSLAQVNALDGWRFTEWFHGRTLAPMGMAGQSWNAATFLLAQRTLQGKSTLW